MLSRKRSLLDSPAVVLLFWILAYAVVFLLLWLFDRSTVLGYLGIVAVVLSLRLAAWLDDKLTK